MSNRLIFMGSDPIALPALEAIRAGLCGRVDIVAVYTQPDRPRGRGKKVVANEIKQWAAAAGIPVCQPERMRKEQRSEIEAMEPDAILVMAYGHMLSQALIDAVPRGIWNLHTSLLPKYRGASPIQCAVASGEIETGVSLMKVVREMDAGPILDVEKVGIDRLDTALDVDAKLSQACVPLLRRNMEAILSGAASPAPQDELEATYVRKLGKEDGDLDFRQPAADLARRINGLFPWPGTRFYFQDLPIKVGLADWRSAEASHESGMVLGLEKDGLAIACGEGVLLLKQLQRPGGKMLEAEAFLRGFEFPCGTVLGSRPLSILVEPRKE